MLKKADKNNKFDGRVYIDVGEERILYRQNKNLNRKGFSPNLGELTSESMLENINSRIRRATFARLILVIFVLISSSFIALAIVYSSYREGNIDISGFSLGMSIVFITIGFCSFRYVDKLERKARTTLLYYQFSNKADRDFKDFSRSLYLLSGSDYLWKIDDSTHTWDWKRNAGASSLVKRSPVQINLFNPPYLTSNLSVYGIKVHGQLLCFFPDQILMFKGGQYHSIKYTQLNIECASTIFIEDSASPSDARLIRYTWRYVRKDGGPDMRFTNNKQIPVYEYGYLLFSMPANLQLMGSSFPQMNYFSQAYAARRNNEWERVMSERTGQKRKTEDSRYRETNNEQSRSNNQSYRKTYNDSQNASSQQHQKQSHREASNSYESEDPYKLFKLSPTASWEEISIAYRKLAQMYHPDKVANLAPEFQELADVRMKQINAAYEQLKTKFGR